MWAILATGRKPQQAIPPSQPTLSTPETQLSLPALSLMDSPLSRSAMEPILSLRRFEETTAVIRAKCLWITCLPTPWRVPRRLPRQLPGRTQRLNLDTRNQLPGRDARRRLIQPLRLEQEVAAPP